MDKKITGILAAGILVTILLFLVDIYLAGIALIILVVIVMSLMIMQDTLYKPYLSALLREDAKAIVITNTGNSPAANIHVSLIPLDIGYDLPSLAIDESHEYPLSSMVGEVKALISYENEKGQQFSHTCHLSATREVSDLLKPVIPLFGWK